jgi:hypothetical protein
MNYRLSAILLTLTLCSCSLFKSEFEPFTSVAPNQAPTDTSVQEPKILSEVQVQALPERNASKNDSITIKWLVPDQALDGYVIRYGFSATSLDYEERIRWSQLAIDADSDKRKIFVHTLRGLPVERTVFLSIAALREDQLSAPTAIFSVQPTEKN